MRIIEANKSDLGSRTFLENEPEPGENDRQAELRSTNGRSGTTPKRGTSIGAPLIPPAAGLH